MEVLKNFNIEINTPLLMKKLRIEQSSEDELEFVKQVRQASVIANPKALYLEGFIESKGDDFVVINGVNFTSRVLRKNLENVEKVFVYIATCGVELDTVKFDQQEFLKKYWWDTIKNYFLKAATNILMEYIKKRYMLNKTAIIVPGGGESGVWNIEQQKQLFSLFGNVEKLIGVRLTETYLMVPDKSVSGFLFQTERDYNGCKICRRQNCTGRIDEFDEQLWKLLEIEASLKLKVEKR